MPSAVDMQRPVEPLWRGMLVYRTLTLISVSLVLVWRLQEFASPAGAVTVLVAMAGWTLLTGIWYIAGRPDRRLVALADLLVTVAVMATTPLVQSPQQLAADAPVMGSIWTSGAVLACALAFGLRGGALSAVVVSVALVAFQARMETELGDIQLMILAGLTIGYAATVLRRSGERLRVAIAAEAAMAERDRLAREVHDGVLQVLGYVKRRGAEVGGTAGELGRLAGEQEFTLRALLTTGPVMTDAQGGATSPPPCACWAAGGSACRSRRTRWRCPPGWSTSSSAWSAPRWRTWPCTSGRTPRRGCCWRTWATAWRSASATRAPASPPGRLEAAASEGRLGVAKSMRGRVMDLGGTISCETAPGRGTDWVFRVPRAGVARDERTVVQRR
jgi:signal transduction histidine kinase